MYADDRLTVLSQGSFGGITLPGWLLSYMRLAESTHANDRDVALLTIEVYLIIGEGVWQTENPMRPARDLIDSQKAVGSSYFIVSVAIKWPSHRSRRNCLCYS
jgi:hypothetical protein